MPFDPFATTTFLTRSKFYFVIWSFVSTVNR